MRNHRCLVERWILFNDYRLDYFAAGLIGLPDNTHLEHAFVAGDYRFDLVWINIETGYKYHVLESVDNAEESLFIHCCDVTGL